MKSRLNDESIATRATDLDLKWLYDETFGYLSGISHMMLQGARLYNEAELTQNSLVALKLTIESFRCIAYCVVVGFELQDDSALDDEVAAFVADIKRAIDSLSARAASSVT